MPLVDALMREMNATGFMPNRGRMIVACYFAMDLKQDWRYGAHYFEEKLIDHDVQSNYGGWSSSAGIGAGQARAFNTTLQSTKFDPEGAYIRMWVTELANVPNDFIHDPWNMPIKIMQESGVKFVNEVSEEKGTYPKPIACEKYTSADAARKVKRSKSAKKQGVLSFAKK